MFRMPLPNMTTLFPDYLTSVFPDVLNELLMSSSTSSLSNDQLASINSTMVALLSPNKHCAFPVYGLAVWTFISPLVMAGGCFVIITVTAIVLYFLPSEVENVGKAVEPVVMSNVLGGNTFEEV